MAKIKNDDNKYFIEGLETNKQNIEDFADNVEENMLKYGHKVITDRAIPDYRDGMKPVHRRILYAMYKGKFISNKLEWKSARIVGDVIGKYHPHGDISVYDAAVNLIVNWKNNYPLIIGKGDYGNIDGDNAAAMRYSEMKISPEIADTLFENLELKNSKGDFLIDMIPNYDNKEIEPVYLSTKLPYLLFNGSMGIAYSLSTNIASFNKNEIINGMSNMIDKEFWNGNYDEKELLNYIKGPDFPTGCDIYEKKSGDLENFILEPYGTIHMRSTIEINRDKKEVTINSIPIEITTDKVFKELLELYKNFLKFKTSKTKFTQNYLSLKEEPFNATKLGQPEIVLTFTEDCNLDIEINKLFKYVTRMDKSFNSKFRVLDENKKVQTIGLPKYLDMFLKFRKEMLVKKTKYELEKLYEDLEKQEGIYLAINSLEDIQRIIKEASDKGRKENLEVSEVEDFVINSFMTQIKLNEKQAKYIADMKSIKLASTRLDLQKIKINDLNIVIKNKEDLLNSDKLLFTKIQENLLEYKDNKSRKSKIISNVNIDIEEEDLIENKKHMIVYTYDERIYKNLVENFKTQRKGTRGKKLNTKEDIVSMAIEAESLDNVAIISNLGRMFLLKAYMIPNDKSFVKNFFNMEEEEKVIEMVKITQEDLSTDGKFISFVTDKGLIKKTKISEFKSLKGKGTRGIKAITLNEGDSVNSAFIGNGNKDIIIVGNNNKAIKFEANKIPFTSRTSKGVIGIRMGEGFKVMKSVLIEDEEMVMTIFTEDGKGKKFSVSSIRKINRGGKGVNVFNADKNDTIMINAIVTKDTDEIILITQNGIINKINSNTINEKRKQAVMANKIMDIDEGDKLMVVFTISNEEEVSEVEDDEKILRENNNTEEENI